MSMAIVSGLLAINVYAGGSRKKNMADELRPKGRDQAGRSRDHRHLRFERGHPDKGVLQVASEQLLLRADLGQLFQDDAFDFGWHR